jgi:hypothetical protein
LITFQAQNVANTSSYLQDTAFTENADSKRSERLQFSNNTIATWMLSPATTAFAQREFSQQHWVSPFQNLGVRDLMMKETTREKEQLASKNAPLHFCKPERKY